MSEVVTLQARTVGQVVYAVLEGDLTKKVELDARGEYWAINETVNSLVEHLRNLADELNGVALEIGLEGRLGRQARDHGAKGSWAHLVVNVNRLAENVTIQMRSFGYVALAVTAGDFTKKIDWDGENEVFWVKEAMNGMIEHLSGVATEIRRISREIGTDGKLGGQILPDGMHGTWADLTTDVNSMSENLTVQLRSLGFVTKAVVTGDLSHLITIEAQGEMEAFIYTVNHMVQDLRSVTSEVIHVATEVDRGHLGSQATAKDTEGVWKDMIRAINRMSDTVTNQVRAVGAVTKAVLDGDLTRKVEAWIEAEAKGEFLEAVYIVNATVDQLREFASQMNRIALCYGKEGRLGLIMGFDKEINGTWLELCDNFNRMAGNITRQLRDIYGVSVAVLTGDLTKKLDWNCQGEILHIMRTQNAMVEHLGLIAGRITSVVGTEAFEHIPDHSYHIPLEGRWAEAIEPVDHVAGTHINQMRAIASLLTAVVRGDLSSQLEFEAEGEMLDLKTIVNTMVRRLNALASEVTAVLVEIGLRGQLGAVANINDAEGAWGKMVTELNRMSVNVTSQVRCLAAVTKSIGGGDLTRKVDIECFGEFDGFAEAVDSLVDCLKTFHDEIRGLMIAIGTEGVLGGVAKVPGLGGSWASLTGDINTMSDKLTNQLRAIYTVTRNIARGDFSVFTDVEAQGETLELLNIVRSTQAQILMLRAEVARVVSEAGEGKGDSSPAIVMGAMGGWQALLDDVNVCSRAFHTGCC
ncbi:hypothetical protein CALCODRAFT_108385 [Calocera cornea HHB12733]|uniref:HAMP domain-containing protein n=1 Tax=Calocera cornea HHB12733 TaxID=1353952 RepID=A0A165IGX8_9BASI|nr:hypothetical protein CALCODRAFT_108385 [Calocera cornea HHB12733]